MPLFVGLGTGTFVFLAAAAAFVCWHAKRSEARQRLLQQLRARSNLASLAARLNPAEEAEEPAAECGALPTTRPQGEGEVDETAETADALVVQGEPLRASTQEI